MKMPDERIAELQQEVAYYKKQLNELSGSVVSRDYRVAEMNNEIKQMQTGFELIAALNQFKPVLAFEEIYDHFSEEINSKLQNDLSFFLQPVDKTSFFFIPRFIKGNPVVDVLKLNRESVYIDALFIEQKKSLLVNSHTIVTPFIELLTKAFGIPYFILTPVIVRDDVIAYLFTGRKIETVLFATSRLLMHDALALEAIAGVIAAIKNQHDQFELLEKERSRISSDMHDEIGSGITHIALLSQLIQTQPKDTATFKKDIHAIATYAHKLVQTISEIIWALNPHNDTLENLLAYTREQSQLYFESLEMQLIVFFPEIVPDIKLSNAQRRNLYLVTREGLTNVIKHSEATAVQLKLDIVDKELRFSITDNGKGINEKKNRPGSNGLRNMKNRMEDISGTIEWVRMDKGLAVNFSLPF